MNILITTWSFAHFSGAETYARDFATELQRRGHRVAIYTIFSGRLAEVASAAGLQVVTDLRDVPFLPDIVHGHHQPSLVDALLYFPRTPAVFILHDATSPLDEPFAFPRIRRFVAVDRRCLVRLLADSTISSDQCQVILNSVDLDRFKPRQPLPERPTRALVFSSYATERSYLPAVQEACRLAGLPVDVIGRGVGKLVETPEDVLGRYDLIFAKARCAIEAMAVGAAVVLCDFSGLGPMVTTTNFDALRLLNFGAGTLISPLRPEFIMREIANYDSRDAALVHDRIRAEAGAHQMTDRLLDLYREILADPATERAMGEGDNSLLLARRAHWRASRCKEALIVLMRRVRQIPVVGPSAYWTWRTVERAVAGRLLNRGE